VSMGEGSTFEHQVRAANEDRSHPEHSTTTGPSSACSVRNTHSSHWSLALSQQTDHWCCREGVVLALNQPVGSARRRTSKQGM
jgi:hypothetical protein